MDKNLPMLPNPAPRDQGGTVTRPTRPVVTVRVPFAEQRPSEQVIDAAMLVFLGDGGDPAQRVVIREVSSRR